jgi:hypothetical protein
MKRILASMAAMAFVYGRAGIAEASAGARGLAVLESVLEQMSEADHDQGTAQAAPEAESEVARQ